MCNLGNDIGSVLSPITSLLGGSSGGASKTGTYQGGIGTAPVYQPQYQSQADTGFINDLGTLASNNVPAGELSSYQSILDNVMNNQKQYGLMDAANQAGVAAGGVGQQDLSASNNMFAMGNSLAPYAQTILNTAFDPQSALYNRTAQQLTDQTRAGNEARGIDMSATGAGLENQALSNFNIDWQNNQLNRETQGATSAEGINSQVSSDYGSGANLGNQGVDMTLAAGAIPYASKMQIDQDKFNALNTMSQAGTAANSQVQQTANDYLNYLNQGRNSAGTANQAAQAGFNNFGTTASGVGGLLGSAASSLGGFFGGSGAAPAVDASGMVLSGGGSAIGGGISDALAFLGFL